MGVSVGVGMGLMSVLMEKVGLRLGRVIVICSAVVIRESGVGRGIG